MSASFPAILAAVAARGPRCGRCERWTMDPDQSGYTDPMCDGCAEELEAEPELAGAGPVGPYNRPRRVPRRLASPVGTVCGACTTWRCLHCGWIRRPAWKGEHQECGNCGSRHGTRHPVYHRSGKWYVHNVMRGKV